MGIGTHLRSLVATLALGLLTVALASAEVVACGDLFTPSSDGCCNSDGTCKTSPDQDSSGCCLKARPTELQVVEQQSQADMVTERTPQAAAPEVPPDVQAARDRIVPAQYAPPQLFVLNSSFLI